MSNRRTALIIAHRGASADHPENTVAAFHGARDQGADWVEIDVRLSVDGVLVVHHDAVYPDGRPIAATPADDRPEYVPLLAEALEACSGMGVNVEIKNSPGDLGVEADHDVTVADLVVEAVVARADGGAQPVLVTSFDEPTLHRVRSASVRVDTGLLTWNLHADPEALDRSARAGDVAVNPWDPFIDEPFMARCVALGLKVNSWTVDDPQRMVELVRLGVHGIITNVPGRAREALA
jgi:glycerophosphoryl diester phosphodiesterase